MKRLVLIRGWLGSKIGYTQTRQMVNLGGTKRRSPRSGFTLIELLVVISIIGILITLTFVAVVPIQRKSRDARRKADVNSFLAAANLFKADFKIYPNPTFYLGSFGGSSGDPDSPKSTNSNFGLDGDVPNCNPATLGNTASFTSDGATHTQADLNTLPITLKPGFVAADNFMICFRYIDRVLSDPKPANGGAAVDQYQYRVSFDYGDILVAAELENGTTDTDATRLFTDSAGTTYKRYYRGSGVVVRHLDDSSDVNDPTNTTGFTSGLAGLNNDGGYLYQCLKDNLGALITRDNRVQNEPIVSDATSPSGYKLNPSCQQNTAGGLDVRTSN